MGRKPKAYHKTEPVVWSSSTLYTDEIKELRNKWFQQWLAENEFTSEAILKFHHSEIGDKEQAILMKRKYVETVSITSVKKQKTRLKWCMKMLCNPQKLPLILHIYK